MIIRQNKGYEVNPMFPNSDWYNQNNYVVEDGSTLANKIISLYPYYDFVLTNGQLTDVTAIDPPLDQVKKAKKAELQSASDQACATFTSSALGSVKTYLADEKSMTFLAGEYTFVKSPDYDNSTLDWFTVEDNTFVTHTGAQIAQVFLDGRSWIKQQKSVKLKSKFADVDAATTPDGVNQITW